MRSRLRSGTTSRRPSSRGPSNTALKKSQKAPPKLKKVVASLPALVGETIEVYWAAEREWVLGTVTAQRGGTVRVQYPSSRRDDHEIRLATTSGQRQHGRWRWRQPTPEALPVGPGDVTLLLNDPLHACSGCAKAGAERVLALFFFRLAPQHRAEDLPPPSTAHLTAELSSRESRGMATSFRRGFSFEQSRELFSGTNWRNITNYFVAKRQRKHINAALVRPGKRLMERVAPAVERALRGMSGERVGLGDFVMVEAFCNYYVRTPPPHATATAFPGPSALRMIRLAHHLDVLVDLRS